MLANTHLFDAVGVLLHSNLLHSALKSKERLDVQTGGLLKTRPVLVLRVNLHQHTQTHTAHLLYSRANQTPGFLWKPHSRIHCAQWASVYLSTLRRAALYHTNKLKRRRVPGGNVIRANLEKNIVRSGWSVLNTSS